MYKHAFSTIALLGSLIVSAAAQSDLLITKRSTRTMPGMENLPTGVLSPAMRKQMDEMRTSTTTVYVKGSWMRTDVTMKAPTMTGAMENRTFSTILQCDKRRIVTFDSKKKKYHEGAIGGAAASGPSGGTVLLSLEISDTGERAKMFGFDVRRLKQTLTMTPGPSSCMKQSARIDIDGWYADLPGFSCPMDMARSESISGSDDCRPEFDMRVKGTPAGFAFKETKRVSTGQMTVTIDEVVVDVQRTSLLESLFEPPSGYSLAR